MVVGRWVQHPTTLPRVLRFHVLVRHVIAAQVLVQIALKQKPETAIPGQEVVMMRQLFTTQMEQPPAPLLILHVLAEVA
jgi:hypothetical protein